MLAKSLALSALLTLVAASAALAVDEGNTKPRFALAGANFTSSVDAINQTSVSGNVKGIFCHFLGGSTGGNVVFTVNGGTAQTISLSVYDYPAPADGPGGTIFTGWIPMNIRFSSSIRVQLQHTANEGEFGCQVSWALD
jgi:hypothetical protein